MHFLFALCSFILFVRSASVFDGGNLYSGEYNRAASGGLSYAKWKDYCKADDDWYSRNQCPYDSTGNWSAFLGVFVKLPGASSDRNLTFVADIPYWIVTAYNESGCKFSYTLMWFFLCDSTLCPLVPAGLYMGVQETSNNIIVPNNPVSAIWRQEYLQTYDTPVIPGNPDQTQWTDIHVSLVPHWCVGLYRDANGEVAYEELISIDRPHKHLSHSAQSYSPSTEHPGNVFMNPWIDLDYYDETNGVLPEPANSAYNLYTSDSLPLTTYAPGKSAYMLPILVSGKRQSGGATLSQSDYNKYKTSAQKAKDLGVFPKSSM